MLKCVLFIIETFFSIVSFYFECPLSEVLLYFTVFIDVLFVLSFSPQERKYRSQPI